MKALLKKLSGPQFVTALVLSLLAALQGRAHATGFTIPDLGVDLPGAVTTMGTELGTIIVAVVALGIAIMVVWLGFRYLRRAK